MRNVLSGKMYLTVSVTGFLLSWKVAGNEWGVVSSLFLYITVPTCWLGVIYFSLWLRGTYDLFCLLFKHQKKWQKAHFLFHIIIIKESFFSVWDDMRWVQCTALIKQEKMLNFHIQNYSWNYYLSSLINDALSNPQEKYPVFLYVCFLLSQCNTISPH